MSEGRRTKAVCVSHTQLYVYTAVPSVPTKFSRYLKFSSVESGNMTCAAHARRGEPKGHCNTLEKH